MFLTLRSNELTTDRLWPEGWWGWKSGGVDHQTDRPNPQWKVLLCFSLHGRRSPSRVSLKELVAYYNNNRSRFRSSRKKNIISIFPRPKQQDKTDRPSSKMVYKVISSEHKKSRIEFSRKLRTMSMPSSNERWAKLPWTAFPWRFDVCERCERWEWPGNL